MGSKTRVGMLCVFKERDRHGWYGYIEPSIFQRTETIHELGSRFVTVLEKKGALNNKRWVSYAKVLGQDQNGKAIIVWVPSALLKPCQESRNSQSKL